MNINFLPLVDLRRLCARTRLIICAVLVNALLASSAAIATDTQVSSALDSPSNNFTAEYYRVNNNEFSVGGSSVEITTYPFSCCAFHFLEGVFKRNHTVTFDYRYDRITKSDLFVPEEIRMELLSLDRRDNHILPKLPSTDGQWCRHSIYVTDDFFSQDSAQVRVRWSSNKAPGSRSLLLYDNIQSQAGNNVRSPRCVDDPSELGLGNGANITSILGLLLDDVITEPGEFVGVVSLPLGTLAPAGGAAITISTFPIDFEFGSDLSIKQSSVDVLIPAGQNSVPYVLDLFDPEPSSATKKLNVECTAGCDSMDVTTAGFWNESSGFGGLINATGYDHFSEHTVNIALEDADTFSGSIEMPEGLTVSGPTLFSINVEEVDGDIIPESYSYSIEGTEGGADFPFHIGVPSDTSATEWRVSVKCLVCAPEISRATLYASTISGGVLTEDNASAFGFGVGSDYTGIIMTLQMVAD